MLRQPLDEQRLTNVMLADHIVFVSCLPWRFGCPATARHLNVGNLCFLKAVCTLQVKCRSTREAKLGNVFLVGHAETYPFCLRQHLAFQYKHLLGIVRSFFEKRRHLRAAQHGMPQLLTDGSLNYHLAIAVHLCTVVLFVRAAR